MTYSGWVLNTSLTELTAELAESSLNKGKLRKELRAAFELAVEQHPLDFYKDILKKFEEETIKAQEAYEAAAATPKQSKKSKAKAVAAADEDEDMPDATESTKKTKKRKAEEDVSVSIICDSTLQCPCLPFDQTPQRPDSVKKPKIKLNTSSTPKTANGNGNGTPQPKDASAKASKPKPKKTKDGADKKAEAKEKMTPEERHARKEVCVEK
jgi:hypothetical protein